MNILFLTLNSFSSIYEKGIYTDLLREFTKDNHNLFVVTPVEKSKNEQTTLLHEENIKILKLRIGNIQKTNLLEKGITTITIESKFKYAIRKYFHEVKFDLVLYTTPPITLHKAVEFVKKRDHAKTYLLLKDIFPQNAVDLNILKTSGFYSILYMYFRLKEKKLYKISDFIGCMSNANVEFLLKNNSFLYKENIEVCPNSIEPISVYVSEREKDKIRLKYNIPIDKTVFVYGGNLGKPQGINFLIDCLRANEFNSHSFFLIVGSGTEFEKLALYFYDEKPNNAMLLNQLSKNDYELLVNSCDVGLIFLDKRFEIPNFPSRILSYMQASMPVLAATDINTDIGNVIEVGNFGYWCESRCVTEFNKLVVKLCDKDLRLYFGKNSRLYLEKHFTVKHSYKIIMKHFK